jgi:hypothetical protein
LIANNVDSNIFQVLICHERSKLSSHFVLDDELIVVAQSNFPQVLCKLLLLSIVVTLLFMQESSSLAFPFLLSIDSMIALRVRVRCFLDLSLPCLPLICVLNEMALLSLGKAAVLRDVENKSEKRAHTLDSSSLYCMVVDPVPSPI